MANSAISPKFRDNLSRMTDTSKFMENHDMSRIMAGRLPSNVDLSNFCDDSKLMEMLNNDSLY